MNVNFSTHNLTRLARWRWLLAVLIVLIVLAQSAAPAAYAFPVEPPPSCTVVGWGNNGSGRATPPAGPQRCDHDCRRRLSQPDAQV